MTQMIKNKKTPALKVVFDRETDGRWIAEIPRFPGAMAYGDTKQKAMRKAYGIALRVMADNIEQGRMRVYLPQFVSYAMA